MKYETHVPTKPGWYWRRDRQGQRIVELPHCGQWPTHWLTMKQETLAFIEEQIAAGHYTREDIAPVINRPEADWLVEWAGPIEPPA